MKLSFKKIIHSFFSGSKYYIVGVYKRFSEEDIFFLSSGIAFNGILCFIPLLLLMTSLLGMFLHSSIFSVKKIDDILIAIFPPQPYAQQIKTSIKSVIGDIIRYRSAFGLYGIGILIWTAASLFTSVRMVLNKIYRLKTSKLFLRTILENILLVIALGILFLIANFFTWILLMVNSILKELPMLEDINIMFITNYISFSGSYLPALLMFFIVNRFIPDKGITSKVAFISALTTTTLWWIAGKGFGWYLNTFHPYKNIYGTYTFLLVFLLWIYYSATVFLIGAVVGGLYRERYLKT